MSMYSPSRAREGATLPRIILCTAVAAAAVLPASPGLAASGHGLARGAAAAKKAKDAPNTDDAQLTPLERIAKKLPPVTAQDVLRIAASKIGVTENADGGGTEFQRWYMSTPRALETLARDGGTLRGYANAPWCAMFVSWVGEQAGIRPVLGWDAYTVTYAKWFQANRHWGTAPKPGAVVFFDWGGSKDTDAIDHVGLVERDNGDGTITTIEGNTGNGKVERRVRPTWQVVGYGYPAYPA
ncbi:CHAP domain-containing protein [Thermopolyspora sp. NPDC052614]|uniref:CHAP domain-containing protein n=1 Tax=Thermopolyspora sp. NPDC052614 TaxID=3155682 RepID=UPI00342843BC